MRSRGRYQVGSAVIDLGARQVFFPDTAVDVPPKVFDLLVHLLVNRDRVVSKDELFDEIWPKAIVTEATLSQTVKRARDLFRNQGFEQTVIRTVSRRGFQFNIEVLEEHDEDDPGDAAAHDLVVRAVWDLHRSSRESERSAERHLREALEKSPGYVPALVRLAEVLRRLGTKGELPRQEAFDQALAFAEQAVRRDPHSGLGYLQLAEMQHRHFWDFEAAAESYRLAVELMPESAEMHGAYSRFLAKSGRHPEAVSQARAAFELDCESAPILSNLTLRLIKARELDDAQDAVSRLRDTDPEHSDLAWLEASLYLRSGADKVALRCINAEELDYLRLSLTAVIYFRLGRVKQAQDALSRLIESDGDGAAFQVAEVYAQWGQPNEAFPWLERALECGDPGLAELYSSLLLEEVYHDARFDDLARRVGLPPRDG